jgi:RimJ/RimL family protein N-acetyltransferase
MKITDTILTTRLTLHKAKLSDAEELFNSYLQDPEVTRFTTWLPHKNINVTEQFLSHIIGLWNEAKEYNFVISKSLDNKKIGMVKIADKGEVVTIGYVFAKSEWNKGYATEVVNAVVHLIVKENPYKKIAAFCDVENIASSRVLEKAGFSYIKTIPKFIVHPSISDQPRDVKWYEFESRKNSEK